MATNSLHESAADLSAETRDMHRALLSLMEELEAVDWYAQRIDATGDPELARVLAHNRDEEKEHACMTLEWIRRHDPKFDAYLRKFLFRSGPIAHGERAEEAEGSGDVEAARTGPGSPSLGIGSLRPERSAGEAGNGKKEVRA